MIRTRFKKGRWKAQCEVSGFTVPSDEMLERWDGRMVHEDFWEPRHPQEYVRVIPDNQATPWVRTPDDEQETSTYGIGVWAVGWTNVVAPAGIDPENYPVQFELWMATDYTDAILGAGA